MIDDVNNNVGDVPNALNIINQLNRIEVNMFATHFDHRKGSHVYLRPYIWILWQPLPVLRYTNEIMILTNQINDRMSRDPSIDRVYI